MSKTHTTRTRTAATKLSQRLRRRRLSNRDRHKTDEAPEQVDQPTEPARPVSQR